MNPPNSPLNPEQEISMPHSAPFGSMLPANMQANYENMNHYNFNQGEAWRTHGFHMQYPSLYELFSNTTPMNVANLSRSRSATGLSSYAGPFKRNASYTNPLIQEIYEEADSNSDAVSQNGDVSSPGAPRKQNSSNHVQVVDDSRAANTSSAGNNVTKPNS